MMRVDPLTYGVDGLRAALIGVGHYGVALDLGVLAMITVALPGLGARLFSKIQL